MNKYDPDMDCYIKRTNLYAISAMVSIVALIGAIVYVAFKMYGK